MTITLILKYRWKNKDRIFSVSTLCEEEALSSVLRSFEKHIEVWGKDANPPQILSLDVTANFGEANGSNE